MRTLFPHFRASDEKTLTAVLRGEKLLPSEVLAARQALACCRNQIIENLKTTSAAERRRELRTLYEGVSIVYEFICEDEAVPAVRDF